MPGYVHREFEEFLQSGRLEHGFLRVRCESCHAEHLVAFSCKRRGFCPSCGARRTAETAALLVDEVLPEQPIPKALAALAGQALAGIEDPLVIQKILNHQKEKGEYDDAFRSPESRGLPQTSLFG